MSSADRGVHETYRTSGALSEVSASVRAWRRFLHSLQRFVGSPSDAPREAQEAAI